MTIRAVRIYEYEGPDKLIYELDVPDPAMDADMVLIELVATSVNPIDWKIRSGARQKDFPMSLPAILGRDVSGIVRAVGSEVRHVKIGDQVLALANATYAQFGAVKGVLVTHAPIGSLTSWIVAF